MNSIALGLVLEPLGLPVRAALEQAAILGARCVQWDASGDLHPDALTATGRRELRVRLRSQNLDLAAVQVPLRRGLDVAEQQQGRIDHIRKVMTLAYDLGARTVSVAMPRLPTAGSPRAETLKDSLLALGSFGEHVGVRLALEGGLDAGDALRTYLEPFGGCGVTFDPANFLANGHDPLASLASLASRLVHVQARDLRAMASGPKEVPVGAGDLEWVGFLAALDASGYRGAMVVDREEGSQRATDVARGFKFLQRFVAADNIAKI